MLKIIETGVTFHRSQLGEHFPNVSAPEVLSAEDMEHLGLEEVQDPPPPPPTPEEIQRDVVLRTQMRLDAFAATRNYDGILSACTYAASSVARFAADGQYAVNARDATWAALYALLNEVLAGERPMPQSYDDVEPLLPELAWPAEAAV